MALLDLSRAFYRVLKEDLSITMIERGIQMKRVAAFLGNRQFKVLLKGILRKAKWFIHGVLQGGTTSLLLFLFYIDSVAKEKNQKRLAFFSVLLLIRRQPNSGSVEQQQRRSMQPTANQRRQNNRLVQEKKMIISDKSMVTFFCSASTDSKWSPIVNIMNEKMKFNPASKLLGLHVKKNLPARCQQDVEYIVTKINKICSALTLLGSPEWGWRKKSLTNVYFATQRSIIGFVAPA